eukprot:jgi/Botrbrau1/4310/Bobra.0232s0002.2
MDALFVSDLRRTTSLLLICNAQAIYSPGLLPGIRHVLVGGGEVLGLLDDAQATAARSIASDVLDAKSCIVVPGFVDMHVHITGGGGEAGPASRCPEAQLSSLLNAGITTVVGVTGTDSVTRSQENLVAKCRSLNVEGITAYHWAGGYRYPTPLITASPQHELCLIDTCIGVGEIAVSDHRSSVPTAQDLARLASEVRVGGMLSGKAGLLYCHMGSGATRLQPLRDAMACSDVPITQFLPTHMSRTRDLAAEGLDWLHQGGWLDFTASPEAATILNMYQAAGDAPLGQVTVSSDAYGSLPVFDEKGKLIAYEVASPGNLFRFFRELVLKDGWPLERALPLVTRNPATVLKLKKKGEVLLQNFGCLMVWPLISPLFSIPACATRLPNFLQVFLGYTSKKYKIIRVFCYF